MTVLIKARRSSIANKEGKKLYYPSVVTMGTLTTKELGDKIAAKSALTRGDVRSVLDNMTEEINAALRDGKSVRLEGLGSLFLTVHSDGNGVETKEEVNASQIVRTHVNFREETTRSAGTTRAALSDAIHFQMADSLAESLDKDGVTDGSEDAGTGGDAGGETGGDAGGDTGGDTGGDLLG